MTVVGIGWRRVHRWLPEAPNSKASEFYAADQAPAQLANRRPLFLTRKIVQNRWKVRVLREVATNCQSDRREHAMGAATPTSKVLDREFLELRATLITLAAALDRISRAGEADVVDPRWERVQRALRVLLEPRDDRAEEIQLIFSRPYNPNWRREFELE